MAPPSKIQIIEKYLDHPTETMNINSDQNTINMFFASLLGDHFIHGYRLFQNINSQTVILSLMQYSLNPLTSGNPAEDLPQYKIIKFEIDVILDKTKRSQIFKNLLETAQCFDSSVEINIIYLKGQKYSVMNKCQLQQSRQPDSKLFFKQSAEFIPENRGYKHIDVKTQGTRLHGTIQYFLKGNGHVRNMPAFKRDITGNQQEIKFQYELKKVINTLRLIVGKEIFANDYWIMNSEKWMRKKTQKKFKRFDLILRNQHKICIIDWKFSKNKADQKITKGGFVKKNKLYLELAKNDYKADVQLKFYCIHSESVNENYHKWTEASFDYKPAQVMLDDDAEEQDGDDSSQEIEFMDDRQNRQRAQQENNWQKVQENGNFFELERTQERSMQYRQEFRQRHGIAEEKPKPLEGPNLKNVMQRCDKDVKNGMRKRCFDEEYNPGKNLEKQNRENEDLRRGKRSKPVELIGPGASRWQGADVRRKKSKLNQNSLKDEVISISSKGQKMEVLNDDDDEIEFLDSEFDSMELGEERKVAPKPLLFDPKLVSEGSKSRYLTVIGARGEVQISSEGFQLQISIPNSDKTKQSENERNRGNTSYGEKIGFDGVRGAVRIEVDLRDQNPRSEHKYDEQLLECFEDDEEEQKQNTKETKQVMKNSQSLEQTKKRQEIPDSIWDQIQEVPGQREEIEQIPSLSIEKPLDTLSIETSPSLKTWNEKKQVNTEALRRSYEKDLNEKKRKKNCEPRHYLQIIDSDEQ